MLKVFRICLRFKSQEEFKNKTFLNTFQYEPSIKITYIMPGRDLSLLKTMI